MKLGYNTNGLAHHRVLDAIALLADIGYQSVALTLDVGELDPFQQPIEFRRKLAQIRTKLESRDMKCVVETGARFLLNPRRKHDPTLLDTDATRRTQRVEFLCAAIDAAAELSAGVVSLWAGVLPDDAPVETAFTRLCRGLSIVLDHAQRRDVIVGFEPEPGMFIDTNAKFAQLLQRLPHERLKMTMDVGHVHCIESDDIATHVRRWAALLVNVHIEDMCRGVHEHLPFGQGTMDFPPILKALAEAGYTGGVHVELSRDSHRAVAAVTESYNFLAPLIAGL